MYGKGAKSSQKSRMKSHEDPEVFISPGSSDEHVLHIPSPEPT